MWVNPHRVEDGYNGIECDRSDVSGSLRHFFGTDVKTAIAESGHFNGRNRELELVRTLVDAAIKTFGPVREVYLRDRDREVTVSFGDQVENRLWISVGKVHSRGRVHELQYFDRPEIDLWRLDLTDSPRRVIGQRRERHREPTSACAACHIRLPLAAVDSCPNCGAAVGSAN
jgi:hypothetical protein